MECLLPDMDAVITKFEQKDRKPKITDVRSGDTVRVHQTITEGGKKRVQVFCGTPLSEVSEVFVLTVSDR